jgi:hypothetical protein
MFNDPKYIEVYGRPATANALMYCGKCNQRRYFHDQKCEMCGGLMRELTI